MTAKRSVKAGAGVRRRAARGLALLSAPLLLAGLAAAAPGAVDTRGITVAVAAPGRPAAMTALDQGRKPAEILAFARIPAGASVADVMAGDGYYSELVGRLVGPKGRVTGYVPEPLAKGDKFAATWTALTARQPNARLQVYAFTTFPAAPASLDAVLFHLSYHDLYFESAAMGVPRADPAAFLRQVYAALRPGGSVTVVDHAGPPGDARATAAKLHRIDPATVRADFRAAGFVAAGESAVLANPADDRTRPVFDPAVRGATDRFAMRFTKPK